MVNSHTEKRITILVAAHKKFIMPSERELYMPIQVGCSETKERFGFQCDNEGENISFKHKYYSDLSSIYWGWKNLKSDYVGSCQYRRFFIKRGTNKKEQPYFKHILSLEDAINLTKQSPVIVSKKRCYFIETIETHYDHTHEKKDFDILRKTIHSFFPDYLYSFEKIAKKKSAHMFNAFIMRYDFFDSYCNFVFPVLFKVEKEIDWSHRSEFDSRVCGYLGEFLLDTWIDYNHIKAKEVDFKLLGKQKTIRKIFSFFMAKFFNKKYEGSF